MSRVLRPTQQVDGSQIASSVTSNMQHAEGKPVSDTCIDITHHASRESGLVSGWLANMPVFRGVSFVGEGRGGGDHHARTHATR